MCGKSMRTAQWLAVCLISWSAQLAQAADAPKVVKLTPDEQEVVCASEPAVFAPIPGGWGRQGWTSVMLEAADEPTLQSALWMAWRNAAPPAVRKRVEAED